MEIASILPRRRGGGRLSAVQPWLVALAVQCACAANPPAAQADWHVGTYYGPAGSFRAASGAASRGLTELYNFTGGADGGYPEAALVYHGGFLYGTTDIGGARNAGTVFAIDANTGAETVLYSFAGGTDGGNPVAGLIFDKGTLYGTTFAGGAAGNGTVFAVDARSGRQHVLFSFGAGAEQGNPHSGLILQGRYLYGTTYGDGPSGKGTVYMVDTGTLVHAVVHAFKGRDDGANPAAGVISKSRTLYGTTMYGGRAGSGTVFKVDLRTGNEAVIYGFSGSADGANPNAGLIEAGGELYGTTVYGGATGNGTVFKVSPATGVETALYSFPGYSNDASQPNEGANPLARLIRFGGALYGTTSGGTYCLSHPECGTIFSVNPATGRQNVLVRFTGGADGGKPYAGLLYRDGAFYGTTSFGGVGGWGTVFRFVP
jgi:uncharacterized repeat protein (TIGR03803 family)